MSANNLMEHQTPRQFPKSFSAEAKSVLAPESTVHRVAISLCELCLEGKGDECHTPGCALFLHNSPGHPIHKEFYEILSESVLAQRWTVERVEGNASYQRHFAIKQGVKNIAQLYFTKSPVDDEMNTLHKAEAICSAHYASVLAQEAGGDERFRGTESHNHK